MQLGGQDDEKQLLLPLHFLLGALWSWKGLGPALTKAAPGAPLASCPPHPASSRSCPPRFSSTSRPRLPVLSKELPKSSFLPVTTFVFCFIGVGVEIKVWVPFEQDPATVWNLFSQEVVC